METVARGGLLLHVVMESRQQTEWVSWRSGRLGERKCECVPVEGSALLVVRSGEPCNGWGPAIGSHGQPAATAANA
jgi:hypothetical protein